MARLLERYRAEIIDRMKKTTGRANPHSIPVIEKIVISMGFGRAATQGEKGRLDAVSRDLSLISGQKPSVRRARKSVAAFRLREGMIVGAKVTLRGNRMYEFLDRLISIALPRVRDFRGVSNKSFDGHGNYSLGITDQSIFPEVDADRLQFSQGMNVTICVKNANDEESLALLKEFGMPFRS